MKVDVSEIKTYKSCRRQWLLTSRNRFHLRPVVTPSHFALGTIFHESLHAMYMGAPLEKVMQFVRKEISTDNEAALLAMVPGYYRNVLPGDLDRFKVLDIEHHFSFVPADPDTGEVLDPDVEVCGSIDMIVLAEAENAIYGFEHKTCKNFAKTGAFTVSMADAAHAAGCDYVGLVSGDKAADKFARAGFTATKSALVNAPIINELPICIECRVIEFNEKSCILRGEIVNVSVDESALTDGRLDVAKAAPLVFDPFNRAYHGIGEKIGDAWKLGAFLLKD